MTMITPEADCAPEMPDRARRHLAHGLRAASSYCLEAGEHVDAGNLAAAVDAARFAAVLLDRALGVALAAAQAQASR